MQSRISAICVPLELNGWKYTFRSMENSTTGCYGSSSNQEARNYWWTCYEYVIVQIVTEKAVLFNTNVNRIGRTQHSTEQNNQAKKREKVTNQNTTSHFWYFHFDFRLTLLLFFSLFLSFLPSSLHVFLDAFFVLVALMPASKSVSNFWVFASRVAIRTLSISTNKSINMQEVCMLDCCVFVCVCVCCAVLWVLSVMPSQFFLLSVDVDFYFRDKKKTASSISTNEIRRLTNRMSANASCFDYHIFFVFLFSNRFRIIVQ